MSNLGDVKKLIRNSGNSFHCRVVNYFVEKGWSTLVSPYFTDNISGKSREIDLIVEKQFPVYDAWRDKIEKILYIKLFIECKYIPKDTVFWFSDIDELKALDWVVENTPFEKNYPYTQEQHYLNADNRVAKLFATSSSKEIENEPIYKALNQCLNAMVYNRNFGSIVRKPSNTRPVPEVFLEYPIIACNSFDRVYKVDIEREIEPELATENFMLEVNYAYMDEAKEHKFEYFLIDVVSFDKLDNLLESIEKEVNKLNLIMSNQT